MCETNFYESIIYQNASIYYVHLHPEKFFGIGHEWQEILTSKVLDKKKKTNFLNYRKFERKKEKFPYQL